MDRPQRPFFRRRERGVDEGLTEIDLAAIAEIFRESLQEPVEPPAALPELKAPMARLIRRIAARQIGPGRPRAQHPEHAVEHRARIGPRPAAPVSAPARTKRRFEYRPLGVSQVHAAMYDGARPVVTRRVMDL